MDSIQINQLIERYLKENLKININTETNYNYSKVDIELVLGDETISTSSAYVEFSNEDR